MGRSDDFCLFLGRLLMAALFLPSGISKLGNLASFAGSLADKGLPNAELLAAAAVAIEILGSVALILGIYPRLTAFALIAFLIVATGTSHRFWDFADEAQRTTQQQAFFKNVGLIGGFLFYWASGAGVWSLGGRRRSSPR